MKHLWTLPIIMAAALVLALVGTSILLATPTAQAHNPDFLLTNDCGSWTLRINLLADANDPQDHRVVVTDNSSVVTVRDFVGVTGDFLNGIPPLHGSTPASDLIDVFVFTKVEGGYVYSPAVNSLFFPGVDVGQNGLESFNQKAIQLDNTCTPTPTATAIPPTATSVPPTPTQTLPERCIAAGGIWTASGCAAPTVAPVATSTPVPTVQPTIITPPNTGDAGLKR